MKDIPNVQLHIDGHWREGAASRTLPIENPALGMAIAEVAFAEPDDVEEAAAAAVRAFAGWKRTSAYERYGMMRKAAQLLRDRVGEIAAFMTIEQGKPLMESRLEILASADTIDWFAEEGRRAYGRVIPARQPDVYQLVVKEAVGPVAAFSPWNFPMQLATRKVAGALAAGCTVVLKAAEETPVSAAELVRAFVDAGVPKGVVNLVFGDPAAISSHLIRHEGIRKISFTGSTEVGKMLSAEAGRHMKRMTSELGGHAPVIVFKDADIQLAARTMAASKFRNAGQVCISPTRFMIQEDVYDRFVEEFLAAARNVKVGNGLEDGVTMGPMANSRRVAAMEQFVADAEQHQGKVLLGGKAGEAIGNYWEPTVIADLPITSRAMTEEPFGPLAVINRFSQFDDAVSEANRLDYGLAAYAWTRSARTAQQVAASVEAGMITINHLGFGPPETPWGGVKDSGQGSEAGTEGLESYLSTKFVSQAGLSDLMAD